jgi:hypothetical protein
MSRAKNSLSIAMVALALVSATTSGAESGAIEIHGYGGWSYGRSNAHDNRYLASSQEGESEYTNLAIAFAAQPSERVRINAQVWWEAAAGEEELATVDFAFGEWRVSDALRLRLGKVKHPFGIYTEVFDVGTIRPLFWLPQSVYGSSGTVAEAYHGIGITGSTFLDNDWRLEYDGYIGEVRLDHPDLADAFEDAEAIESDEVDLRDLVGGRLTVTLPAFEVRLGLSAYTGRLETASGERHSCLGAHMEYLSDAWSLRSEYTRLRESASLTSNAFYLELARRLGAAWQIAGRIDHSDLDLDGIDTSRAPSLLEHQDLTVGLNYWFDPDFVVKLSASHVDGNRFAAPEDLVAAIKDGGIQRVTRLVSLGVQFAF